MRISYISIDIYAMLQLPDVTDRLNDVMGDDEEAGAAAPAEGGGGATDDGGDD